MEPLALISGGLSASEKILRLITTDRTVSLVNDSSVDIFYAMGDTVKGRKVSYGWGFIPARKTYSYIVPLALGWEKEWRIYARTRTGLYQWGGDWRKQIWVALPEDEILRKPSEGESEFHIHSHASGPAMITDKCANVDKVRGVRTDRIRLAGSQVTHRWTDDNADIKPISRPLNRAVPFHGTLEVSRPVDPRSIDPEELRRIIGRYYPRT